MRPGGLLLGPLLVACAAQPVVPPTPSPTPLPSPTATVEPTPSATPAPTPEPGLNGGRLASSIDGESLRAHLEALQAIADATPGRNRATGRPGFEASVRYVVDRMASYGYEVREHAFTLDGVTSTNVLAERRGIWPEVVIVGAHLDSVAAGPGINDNGSGVATLLVIAERLRELPAPDRTIRFAFWGAEEGGPFGSRAYVASLSADELAAISAYLNLDMLASVNAVRFVYDEDDAPPGSDEITALLGRALDAGGLAWDRIDVDGRSDHGPFAAAGVPIGGLFSGGRELVTEAQAARHGAVAGQPSDPCSDASCDTIDNVDLGTHREMARVAARVLVRLAAAVG
jgi:aminopeptidase S